MPRFAASLFLSVGVSLVVVGACAAVFAFLYDDVHVVAGSGPFDGTWDRSRYYLNSVVALSVGSGLIAFGATWARFLLQQDGSPFFTRRRVLWAVGIPLGVIVVLAGSLWLNPSIRSMSEADRQDAKDTTIEYLAARDKIESHRLMTVEFRERQAARKDRVYYSQVSFRLDRIVPGTTVLEAWAHGYLTKAKKHTEQDEGGMLMIEAQAKRVKFVLRLVRTPGGPWLVDDVQFTEDGV